ncbi:hypothetical protein [Peribacillus asahii]|uniref:hypothetical protein n=1 Tax=Peribacillus asahii TaxID=228899 RepID=UPI00115D9F6A|nr:hypothetical protein [Peribacillus asahii]
MKLETINRYALELEPLQEKYYVSKKKRIGLFGEQLVRLKEGFAARDLSEISTEKLYDITMKTAASLKRGVTPNHFKRSE